MFKWYKLLVELIPLFSGILDCSMNLCEMEVLWLQKGWV